MAIVTEIRFNRGLVEIQADGATVVRVRKFHFDQVPVRVGEDFDADTYVGRLAAIQFSDAYEAALSSLDYCARSSREISNTLMRKGYVVPVVDAVVAKLIENGLIDDARYALRLAETQSNKAVGLYAFKRKLYAKGISDEDAEEALSAFDDSQQQAAALASAQKLLRKYEALPRREARAKLSQALARKGFTWDTIEAAIDQLMD